MTFALVTLVVALLAPAGSIAQAPPPAPDQPPALTELESAKRELLQVRIAYAQLLAQSDQCQAEVGTLYQALGTLRASAASQELTDAETRLKQAIEAARPGWEWNPKTGAFTRTAASK